MKQIFYAIFFVVALVSLIVVLFTIRQVDQEETSLTIDLAHRSTLLADSLKDSIEPYVIGKEYTEVENIVNRFADREKLSGLGVYTNADTTIALSSQLPDSLSSQFQTLASTSISSDRVESQFMQLNNSRIFLFSIPLHDSKGNVIGSLVIAQNATYIDTILQSVWKNNIMRLFAYTISLSIVLLLIIRWIIYRPILMLVESIKNIRRGYGEQIPSSLSNYFFFQPLVNEVTSISKSLLEARNSASLEAKLRLEKLDSPWTEERLKELTKDILKDRTLYVVSNREPYISTKRGGKIINMQPASGMVSALEPVMHACGGMWIAHGSGDADRETVDSKNRVMVPPDEPKYTLKRIWLSKEEEKGYYYGFSNEGLWPLCHMAYTRPVFRKEDWEEYKRVNGKFAETVLKEIKDVTDPLIFIQDYHFALLARMIKKARPDATIAIFWHIPWPNSESFRICPFRKELLDGMLGADLIGFHTQLHCNNFIDTVGRELEALINLEQFTIQKEGHITTVKPFPISIPFTEAKSENGQEEKFRQEIKESLGITTEYIGLGVDRLDYTKGILERLRAIEYFLKTYPSFQKDFTFIQIAPTSRTEIPEYKQFKEDVEREVERINNEFKTGSIKPIIFLEKHHSHEELYEYYRAADVCLVTSLHDGMNLVAKEFVSARTDEKGTLILSQFAGASRELKEAIIINPYNIEQTGEAIHTALKMSKVEQTRRMKRMRDEVKTYNVYRWSADVLKTMVNIES